jgi:Flp pilus assembly protein TadB
MSAESLGIIELAAFFGIALALLGWEYWSLKREIKRDIKRDAEEKRKQQAQQPPTDG